MPLWRNGQFPLVSAVPEADANGMHFEENQIGRIDPLFEPGVQIGDPVLREALPVADDLGYGLDRHEEARSSQQSRLDGKGQRYLPVALYLLHQTRA